LDYNTDDNSYIRMIYLRLTKFEKMILWRRILGY
jgi:hypothetical protein